MSQPTNLVYNPPYPYGFPYYPPPFVGIGDYLFGFEHNPSFPDLFWWSVITSEGLVIENFFAPTWAAQLYLTDSQTQFPYLGITLGPPQVPQDMIPQP
jgi:hypothetical protein